MSRNARRVHVATGNKDGRACVGSERVWVGRVRVYAHSERIHRDSLMDDTFVSLSLRDAPRRARARVSPMRRAVAP